MEGAALLFAYSLGIGVPFVAIALAAASSSRVPDWCRRWSARIEPVAAVLLVSFGVLLATGLYERLVGRLNVVAS